MREYLRDAHFSASKRHFFLLSSRSLFLHNFLLYRVLICLRNERIATWRFNRCGVIGNEKSECYNTQARILFKLSLFSILFALSTVFLDREIVVRRFIYARFAKFTGCVVGVVLINHVVCFKRSWREERQRVSSLFHRSTTRLYLLHVSAVFAKCAPPKNGCWRMQYVENNYCLISSSLYHLTDKYHRAHKYFTL